MTEQSVVMQERTCSKLVECIPPTEVEVEVEPDVRSDFGDST